MNAVISVILIVAVIFGIVYAIRHGYVKYSLPTAYHQNAYTQTANVSDSFAGVGNRKSAEDKIISPAKPCVITGCNNELCADASMTSDCAYRTKYACYAIARCERQSGGSCGWTETGDLKKCLENSIPQL